MSPLPLRLTTQRFDLVWLSPADLRELATTGHLEGVINPSQLLTKHEAGLAEFYAKRVEQNSLHRTWTIRAIVNREQQCLVGHVGFHLAPDSEGLLEVSYMVGEPFRQQGIAKEAVTRLIEAAQATGEVRLIRGCTAPSNTNSKHVLQSLNFSYFGVVNDEQDGPEEVYLLHLEPQEVGDAVNNARPDSTSTGQ